MSDSRLTCGPSVPPPICARDGGADAASPSNAVITATPTIRMECSLILVPGARASQAIGPAGFRGRHPVVPERAAFAAAAQRQGEGNKADDHRQTTQHGSS